jgi:hypothetical protein
MCVVGLSALAAGDGGLGFVIAFSFLLGGAFVVLLLALGEGELAFDAAVAEVEADGDEGEALLAGGGFELAELLLVDEEFAGAEGFVVHGVAMREGADVSVEEEEFAVFQNAVGVFEVGFAFSDGFDFGAAEGDAGFVFVGEEVVEAGGAIEGGVALACGDGVTVFFLDHRPGGLGGRGCLHAACHGGLRIFKFNMGEWLRDYVSPSRGCLV